MKSEMDWLSNYKDNTFNFLSQMQEKDYSYFKYSLSGDLYNSNTIWGLGQLVFASKILYMIDSLPKLSKNQVENIISSIKIFEHENSYIFDPLISKKTKFSLFSFFQKKGIVSSKEQIQRAETRQAIAALICLHSKPNKPFFYIPYTIDGVDRYLKNLNWNLPWSAGSHFSHLLFFYKTNKELFSYEKDLTDKLIEFSINWVNKLQSNKDGAWYHKETSLQQKINGAMKVLTGFMAVDFIKINYVEKLIDLCLSAVNDEHACDNFNIILVLYYCSKISNYRLKDIESFCINRLKIYREFYFPEYGGFSFFKGKANDNYYGFKITKGKNEPDIHGTIMFTWGISLISHIIDIGFKLKIPIT